MSQGGFNAPFLPSWDPHPPHPPARISIRVWQLGISWADPGPNCISSAGGCQEGGREMRWGLPRAPDSLMLGDVLPPKPGKGHRYWAPPLLLPSSFINLPVKHTAEGSFKNHERLSYSHWLLRLIKGVHRDTHTHKTHTQHTHLLNNQAGSPALNFHYYLFPQPHPWGWCPRKGNYPVHSPQNLLTGSGNTSPAGQCPMPNDILNLALWM